MKKGDLSKFIERAVKKDGFAQTVADIRARSVKVPDQTIEADIDDAPHRVRAQMRGKLKARKNRG